MTYLLAFVIFACCLALLGTGYLVARKALTKGCSLGPDCLCKKEGKSPDDCEQPR